MEDDDPPREIHLVEGPGTGIGFGHDAPSAEQKGMQASALIEGYQATDRPQPPGPPPPPAPGIENVGRPDPLSGDEN